MNGSKLFVLAAIALLVLPVAFAQESEKATVVDGTVFTGANMWTTPAAGVSVDVTCEEEADSVVTDSDGYFSVVFGAGDCSMGE